MAEKIRIKIKGELEIVSTEIFSSDVVVGSKVLAKDEDGVIWDVSGRNFPFEMTFNSLPEYYRASYVIELETINYKYIVQANSIEEAKSKLINKNSWIKNENLQFKTAYEAVDGIEEILEEKDFYKAKPSKETLKPKLH